MGWGNEERIWTVRLIYDGYKRKQTPKGLTRKEAEKLKKDLDSQWKNYKDFYTLVIREDLDFFI